MKIVICASVSFLEEVKVWVAKLNSAGHQVVWYPTPVDQRSAHKYQKAHIAHYRRINKANALFILNLTKNGIRNYIGPSVFAEMAFAIGLNITSGHKIKIFYLNPLPPNLPYSTELKLWQKLGWLKRWPGSCE